MTAEQFFIDTSIPIYAAGKPSEHKEACASLLEKIEAGELEAATDTEVLQEILYRSHRLEMDAQGVELCNNVLRLGMRVLSVSKKDIEEALVLFAKYSPRQGPAARHSSRGGHAEQRHSKNRDSRQALWGRNQGSAKGRAQKAVVTRLLSMRSHQRLDPRLKPSDARRLPRSDGREALIFPLRARRARASAARTCA